MGRRSRKRSTPERRAERAEALAEEASPPATPPPVPVARSVAAYGTSSRARMDDAPKAPWHPFPLVELSVLAGLVLIVLAAIGVPERRGLFFVAGFALVCLSGLELSVREHFAGYRSHSSLIAGAAAVIIMGLVYALASLFFDAHHQLPGEVPPLIGLVAFGLLFRGLRNGFRRRTGGIAFRA